METGTRRRACPTDMTDAQWALLEPKLQRNTGPRRPTTVDLRAMVNARLYMNRTGCLWRSFPHDFPEWTTVRYYFDKWGYDGTLERINDQLREKIRLDGGREPEPSMVILDSQRVKTPEAGGERGYDGGKKLKGRKCHLIVETQGYVVHVRSHAADLSECAGAKRMLSDLVDKHPRIEQALTDAGSHELDFAAWVKKPLGWTVEMVKHAPNRSALSSCRGGGLSSAPLRGFAAIAA
ncbi:MAG: IS5 family transposase [Herpetosiphonaceae bacterium]|nr:MAG: IS5 family transposase [Herpetosiphonaceae bacterium]